MAEVKFAYGTKARYDALAPKDLDTLYFTTDTLQMFKGTTEYTKSTKMVSSLPAAGQVQGVIYFRMTDYTMHIWNGVEFVQLNKKTITQIPADATNDDIPTTKAVADYAVVHITAEERKTWNTKVSQDELTAAKSEVIAAAAADATKKADAARDTAKTYANGLNTAMDNRVKNVEGALTWKVLTE